LLVAACSGPPPKVSQPAQPDRVAIVVAELGTQGAKLVALDETGDRQFDLLAPAADVARDMSPAISPDGQWMVFASTRGRPPGETSLWIAKLGVEIAPRQITNDGIDISPTWTKDGKIVFASTREGGDFDLWRIDPDGSHPTQLTDNANHEVSPNIAPDGTIVYAAVDNAKQSHLEQRLPDGTIEPLTTGNDERDPCLSPDGKSIVFTSVVERNGRRDSELWWMRRDRAGSGEQLVDLPPTDESGCSWSRDGRYVLATSVLRGDKDRPLFTSVIFVDRWEKQRRARILRDSAGAAPRVTPAVVTELDHAVLARDPEYLHELGNIMAKAIANLPDNKANP
jgi:Tol biopolymer transport system component